MTTDHVDEPIAPRDSFEKALLRVRDRKKLTPTFLALLRFHCEAPGHTTTAAGIAAALGLANLAAANMQFGKLAHLIADELEFKPENRPDGKPMWWRALASGRGSSADGPNGELELVMRPELVDALIHMKWVKTESSVP